MGREELLQAVEKLRTQGNSIRAIATELGVNRGRVERALKKLALSATESPIPQADTSRAADGTGRDVFVGRRHEMDVLKAALEDSLAGNGRLVMLAGEPGIGKTRTATEFSAYSEMRGAKMLWGRCYERMGAPPYWVWRQAVRSYAREREVDQLRSEMGVGLDAIAEIVPELRETMPELEPLPHLDSAEQARFRLFDSITAFLKRAAQSQPLVIILENLHWADRPSLLLLEFLAQELGPSRLLIIGTYRDEETVYGDPLSLTLGELTKEQHFQRVILSGLAHEDLSNLIESVGGVNPPEALVSAVYEKTEGNPLFVTEVVRMLRHEGRLALGPVPSGEKIELRISEGVRDAIGRRLSHLSESCIEALTVASVIGREFSLDLLDRVMEGPFTPLSPPLPRGDFRGVQLLEVLEEARSAKIIEEVPEAVGHSQFAHVLIQETLAGELSTVRRAELHARIIEVLEELYGANVDAHADELSHHAFEAVSLIGPQKLARYSLIAGERALATYAHEEALSLFQRALEAKEPSTNAHGDGVGPRPVADAETAALLFGLGRAKLTTLERHEFPQALEVLRRAFDYFSKFGDVEGAVAVAEYPKRVAPGVPIRWADVISRALLMVEPDSHDEGRLLSVYGLALYAESGEYDGALKAYGRALAIAQREEDVSLELRTLVAAGHAEAYHLHYQNSLKYDLRAIQLINRFPQPYDEWHARMEVASVSYHTGDLEGARKHAAALLAVVESLHIRSILGQGLHVNMVVSFLEGDWETARTISDRGLQAEPRHPCLLAVRAIMEYTLGESNMGRAYLERLIEVMRASTPGPTANWALTAMVMPIVSYILEADDHSQVAEEAAHVVLFSPTVPPVHAIAARTGLALLAMQQRDTSAAEEHYTALELSRGTMLGGPLDAIMSADRLLGLLAQTMGKSTDATSHFEDAVAFCRKAGYRPELAWCSYEYAALRQAQGEREKALALLEESLAISTELGMRPLAEKVTVLQKKIESQPAGAPQYPDGLTRREVEVLRLIAAGKSNREIADELFLSLRTIERHITNIYTKTDARSKADATAYAFRHGLQSFSLDNAGDDFVEA